ncbi:hypothetical protein BRD04_02875 [Halobacteriales archaeon QS_9_67_17]|nr:MAG: hypothetical protein BRD04_02875 [Halobacteriales archaeon QS_9_67_17]
MALGISSGGEHFAGTITNARLAESAKTNTGNEPGEDSTYTTLFPSVGLLSMTYRLQMPMRFEILGQSVEGATPTGSSCQS